MIEDWAGTTVILQLVAGDDGLDAGRGCWLVVGGRSERHEDWTRGAISQGSIIVVRVLAKRGWLLLNPSR